MNDYTITIFSLRGLTYKCFDKILDIPVQALNDDHALSIGKSFFRQVLLYHPPRFKEGDAEPWYDLSFCIVEGHETERDGLACARDVFSINLDESENANEFIKKLFEQ